MNSIRSRAAVIMSLILSAFALFASLEGILSKNLYNDMISAGISTKSLLLGAVAQDIISAPLAIILAVLAVMFLKQPRIKSLIAIIGLDWYFFYAFGLYVMQGNYTSIYMVYLIIFALSIYSMIWGLLSFEKDAVKYYRLPGRLGILIGGFLIFILVVLVPAWLFRITPDIANHIPGPTYAVFILDLCVVFPALGQIAYMTFRKKPFGFILAGIAMTKTATLCLSWSFSHWFSPLYGGLEFEYGLTFISTLLTIISLALLIPYFLKLNIKSDMNDGC